MTDKTTGGYEADPTHVDALLRNHCGYHLAEPDPLERYHELTQAQVLYDALVAAIRRERGRALAELARGNALTRVAEMARLGSRQMVQGLIAAGSPGPDGPASDAPASDASASDAPASDASASDAPASDLQSLADQGRVVASGSQNRHNGSLIDA
jgi:hypothetical protein